MKKIFNRKAMEMQYLAYLIIALVFAAICIWGYLYLKTTDVGAVTFIKNMFRFGRGSLG